MLLSFALLGQSGAGAVRALRLTRLVRLLTFIKNVPELKVIVVGLIVGLKSVGYIVALLLLSIYLFAVLGVIAFGENDPANFGKVPVAMVRSSDTPLIPNQLGLFLHTPSFFLHPPPPPAHPPTPSPPSYVFSDDAVSDLDFVFLDQYCLHGVARLRHLQPIHVPRSRETVNDSHLDWGRVRVGVLETVKTARVHLLLLHHFHRRNRHGHHVFIHRSHHHGS